MTARAALARLWLCMRIFLILFGVLMGTIGVQLGIRDNTTHWKVVAPASSPSPTSAPSAWPSVRRRCSDALATSLLRGEVRSAAAIAALVGGRDANEALTQRARSAGCRMRVGVDGPAIEQRREGPVRSDDVDDARPDAFLSHSWHDSASVAGARGVGTRSRRRRCSGSTRRASINSGSMSRWRAAGVPLRLQGAPRPRRADLLRRIVIELFTWLGAAPPTRMSPLPPEEGRPSGVSLDTSPPSTRWMLRPTSGSVLGIIEEAFGDFKVFNAAVRSIDAALAGGGGGEGGAAGVTGDSV